MKGILFLGLLLLLAACLAAASQVKSVKEGFKPLAIPEPGPPPQPISQTPTAYAPPNNVIPSAPAGQTSELSPKPFQDPAQDKASFARINDLLGDMNAFADFELESLHDTSDPMISLPLTNFRGDRQRLQDEISLLNRNPGLPSSLNITTIHDMSVNLRYLQKKARELTTGTTEGFEDAAPSPKATADDVQNAVLRTSAEIIRLQSSGSTDPATQKRISVLTQINQQLKTISDDLKSGKLLPADVPLTQHDLKAFLPTISDPARPLTQFLNTLNEGQPGKNDDAVIGAIMKAFGNTQENFKDRDDSWAPRGAFDQAIAQVKNSGSGNPRPQFPEPEVGKFNWRDRASHICESVRMQGMEPGDFGCLANASKVGQDFSWRGYAKMVCTRLETTTNTGLPEVCGCPPVGWAGWRQ